MYVATSRTISKSKELKPSPGLVLVEGEVSKKETAVKVLEAALKHFGRIDLLVNNAGIFMPKAFTDYTEEDYNLVMNTNVASFFYMTQQVIPQMKKQNSGHVVNISAVLADQPSRAAPALLAVLSKSPMPAVSKALALEYAANNIRFNTVSPGIINTPMHAQDNHAALAKFHPLARNFAALVTSCAVGLGLLSSLGHAQTEKSRTIQTENTMSQTSATQRGGEQAADKTAIRPFHVNVPETELTELRRRINATYE